VKKQVRRPSSVQSEGQTSSTMVCSMRSWLSAWCILNS